MSESAARTPRIFHCHPGFPEGEAAQISIDVVNAWGEGLQHDFAAPGIEAGRVPGIAQGIAARAVTGLPDFSGKPSPGKLIGIARALAGYDLVLSHGWGAINIALAHKVFGQSFALPPLIHHETALGGSAEQDFSARRNWVRRVALGSAQSVVVETYAALEAARKRWHVPQARLVCIQRGIATGEFAVQAAPDALPGLIKRKGEFWIGVSPADSQVSALSSLVRALAHLPEQWHLLVLGAGKAAQAARQAAEVEELSHRVHNLAPGTDYPSALSLVDIFADLGGAYSAASEAKQAMAAAKPLVASRNSEAANAMSADNRKLLEPGLSDIELATMLNRLTLSPALRQQAGQANRVRANDLFDQGHMVQHYCRLYRDMLAEAGLPG